MKENDELRVMLIIDVCGHSQAVGDVTHDQKCDSSF